jgi:hypothetical protein
VRVTSWLATYDGGLFTTYLTSRHSLEPSQSPNGGRGERDAEGFRNLGGVDSMPSKGRENRHTGKMPPAEEFPPLEHENAMSFIAELEVRRQYQPLVHALPYYAIASCSRKTLDPYPHRSHPGGLRHPPDCAGKGQVLPNIRQSHLLCNAQASLSRESFHEFLMNLEKHRSNA